MINNIVIVGINRKVSRQVGEILTEQLGMHLLDTIELFEFDNIPRTFEDILKEQGVSYYRKKEQGIIGYASEFENTVIHIESGAVNKKANLHRLKEFALVVYLHIPAGKIKDYLNNQEYVSKELKKFFNISLDSVSARIEKLKKQCNIKINAYGKSPLRLSSEIIRAMNEYFNK